MVKAKLTIEDYQNAASRLHCGIAEIRAVAEVESKGEAFYDDGFPVILFERHKFHTFTDGKFDAEYPEISNKKSGGYGKAGANQRRKFNLAFSLDGDAALKSCSWGKFQIMGFNHKICGFSTVGKFVDAMKESEGAQLFAFVNFVIGNALDGFLRSRSWAKFAKGYNGENYKENNYDTKLAAAYRKYKNSTDQPSGFADSKQAAKGITPTSSVDKSEASPLTQNGGGAEDLPEFTEGERSADEQQKPTELCKEKPSTFTKWVTGIKLAFGALLASVSAYCGNDELKTQLANKAVESANSDNLSTIFIVLIYAGIGIGAGVLLMYIASKFYDKSANRANVLNQQKMAIGSNRNLVNVELNANK